MFKDQLEQTYLFGGNAPFIEELYENYLMNPQSVDEGWRAYFERMQMSGPTVREVPHAPIIASFAHRAKLGTLGIQAPDHSAASTVDLDKQIKCLQIITAYRFLGNRWAQLDPLRRTERPPVPELEPAFYGFTDADLSEVMATGSLNLNPNGRATLREVLDALRQIYCGSIGAEYMYISDVTQKRWLQSRLEPICGVPLWEPAQKRHFLERLTAAETIEKYLHTKYVGQKRFSLEGGESVIVALDELINTAGVLGIKEIVIGMAHRGRLNVLVNILGKSPAELFSEFEGKEAEGLTAGDVKYHRGFSSDISTTGGPVHLTLAFNPSHLEIVDPVVEGSVYARQCRRGDDLGKEVLPVLIHGDGAVAGQGVIQETLNFSTTRGYGTGGTVHVVINNQIAFTTSDPRDTRSTTWCTDVMKMIEAPILHVNGDDPEAVAFVTRLAMEYRQEFRRDVVIDLVCFRKLGHNEQDEPMVTQPLMYKKVSHHQGTRQIYAEKLVAQKIISAEEADGMIDAYRSGLDQSKLFGQKVLTDYHSQYAIDWSPHIGVPYTDECDTRVPLAELQRLSQALTRVPERFTLHPRVHKVLEDRIAMGEGRLPLDWGMAETLSYASLLVQGIPVRLSGEDSGRGTFFHRHAEFHDQSREKWDEGVFIPLQNLQPQQASFQVFNSVLSEEAVLGFEYGYSTAQPNELVIWEAQFGDFANGAQVVIDQFISSGEAKWGRLCHLVMMLPDGYEGQGPEHSSARIERYLQLSAQVNWQICVPSTPAQIFHLLRRQMLRRMRKPLVIFTPKSLLRHKSATSSLEDLATGTFQTVIGAPAGGEAQVSRLLICSGKVYYDLLAAQQERKVGKIAIARIEQLYPYPEAAYAAEVARYPNLREVYWVQESPLNQGAWYSSQHNFAKPLKAGQFLQVVARPASASPAVGYYAKHAAQQKELVDQAFA